MLDIEVWVKVDEDGNYAVGTDAEQCAERWSDDYTEDGRSTRMVRVILHVPAPKPVEIEATVPDMVNKGTATVR